MVSYQGNPVPSEMAAEFWMAAFEGKRNCTTCKKKKTCDKIRLRSGKILSDDFLRWMCCEEYEGEYSL